MRRRRGFWVNLDLPTFPWVKMAAARRLAAILAADVAGYSRLMGADEEGTHERLKAHFRELVDPKIKEYRGRIVKNTGDGFLAEFASVIDALRCAIVVQAGMTERTASIPPDKRIEFRIGIHQGDVVVEEHDIFGEAVNVAARLEGLAEPGGSMRLCAGAGGRRRQTRSCFRGFGPAGPEEHRAAGAGLYVA